jgi:cyclic pyranopterin monophosphate synthase
MVDQDMDQNQLTHVDRTGRARMVDVGDKASTVREAEARAVVRMLPKTLHLIATNAVGKGDVLAVARVAGIMAAKRTSELIPLCHVVPLWNVEVTFEPDEDASAIEIIGRARTEAKTGVEMEALTAVTVAGLTLYDMCKSVDRGMVMDRVRLTYKSGGKSGTYQVEHTS